MSRYRLALIAATIWAAAILYGLWPQFVPPHTTVPVKEVLLTRGLKTQETPDQEALRKAIERLSHEKPFLTILQAGVTFNGEIPLWGLISAVIIGVAAFAALKMQMTAHEKADDDRFNSTETRFVENAEMLAEVRADIKTLLQRHS